MSLAWSVQKEGKGHRDFSALPQFTADPRVRARSPWPSPASKLGTKSPEEIEGQSLCFSEEGEVEEECWKS